MGGAAGGTSTSCKTNQQCGTDSYCAKSACDPSATGTCEKRPTSCSNASGTAVCGCDGVSYYNDCLRQKSGIASARPGPCEGSARATCGGIASLKCPNDAAVCVRAFADSSLCNASDTTGECWVLPETCPGIVIGGNLRPCSNPSGTCASLCEAAKSGHPHYRDNTCPQ